MRWFGRRNSKALWHDEFSVFTADERYVSRRQLTKFLTLTSFSMFMGNAWILLRSWLYKEPSYTARAVGNADRISVGSAIIFAYPGPDTPCILVRTSVDSYAAYSQVCTHLSCAVYYSSERSRLECPCHNGAFSVADGSVLQGPPQRPLPRVVIERQGETLVALRVESGGQV
jgi:nitrite reductase/ring-hydroxylating ferredoxin subunit